MLISELAASANHYSNVIYKLIFFCTEERELAEILTQAAMYPEFKSAANPPEVILEWIIDAGGIEAVSHEEKIRYKSSAAGESFLLTNAPPERMTALADRENKNLDIIKDILHLCSEPKGTFLIEERYKSHPAMIHGKLTPNFFLSELEQAGALVWENGWLTTETGLNFLKKHK